MEIEGVILEIGPYPLNSIGLCEYLDTVKSDDPSIRFGFMLRNLSGHFSPRRDL